MVLWAIETLLHKTLSKFAPSVLFPVVQNVTEKYDRHTSSTWQRSWKIRELSSNRVASHEPMGVPHFSLALPTQKLWKSGSGGASPGNQWQVLQRLLWRQRPGSVLSCLMMFGCFIDLENTDSIEYRSTCESETLKRSIFGAGPIYYPWFVHWTSAHSQRLGVLSPAVAGLAGAGGRSDCRRCRRKGAAEGRFHGAWAMLAASAILKGWGPWTTPSALGALGVCNYRY